MVKFFDRAKVDFIVKEDEGIVIAKFAEPIEVASNLESLINLRSAFGFSNFKILLDRVSTVRGIAKCAKEDKFDIKTGKKIALNRLKNKTTISFVKYVSKIMSGIWKEYSELNKLVLDGVKFSENLFQRLDKTFKEIDNT